MLIEQVKNQVIKEIGSDPFSEPQSWDLIKRRIPKDFWPLLVDRSGASRFAEILPETFKADQFTADLEAHACWERIGNFYKNQRRYYEALSVYFSLYDQFLNAQLISGQWIQKATPLVWIAECCAQLGLRALAKRHLMLSHIEDSIALKGGVSPGSTGVYFRMVWQRGIRDSELRRYAREAYALYEENSGNGLYPEWILQQLDQDWMTEIPSSQEIGVYWCNRRYVNHLIERLGDKKGLTLETLAQYILSCMPGCRTTIRKRTSASEIDIVCSMEGVESDFRSELGRYFVCECKDWKKPVDFSAIAKFCHVLDSIKSRFGIMFSPSGISGQRNSKYAASEPQKLFQTQGIVLVAIDRNDLVGISNGSNFVNLLRNKYEEVRLDLKPSTDRQGGR
jgi:hypothetical protein